MNARPLLVLCLFALFPNVQAQSGGYQIQSKIRTVESRKSERQELPRGDTRVREDEKEMEITLRRMNPTVAGDVEVTWVVLMEDMRGNLRVAELGKTNALAQVGVPVSLRSGTFSLRERNWQGNGKREGSLEESVKGSGVLLLGPDGQELGASFTPASAEADLRKALAPADKAPKRRRKL
jgi:hypothetical protein